MEKEERGGSDVNHKGEQELANKGHEVAFIASAENSGIFWVKI